MQVITCPKCGKDSLELIYFMHNEIYQECNACKYYVKTHIKNSHIVSGYTE